jgi:hypothetical protein
MNNELDLVDITDLVEAAKTVKDDENMLQKLEEQAKTSDFEVYLSSHIPEITGFTLSNTASVLFGTYPNSDLLLNVTPSQLKGALVSFFISKSPFDPLILSILIDGWETNLDSIVMYLYEQIADNQ